MLFHLVNWCTVTKLHFSGAFFGLGVLLGLNYGARMLGFKVDFLFRKDGVEMCGAHFLGCVS